MDRKIDTLSFINDENEEGKKRFDIIVNDYSLFGLLLQYFEIIFLKETIYYTPFDEDIEISTRLKYINEFMLKNDNISNIKKHLGQTPFYFLDSSDNELGAVFLGNITETENGIILWDNFTQGGRTKKNLKDRINYDDDLTFRFDKKEYFTEIKKMVGSFMNWNDLDIEQQWELLASYLKKENFGNVEVIKDEYNIIEDDEISFEYNNNKYSLIYPSPDFALRHTIEMTGNTQIKAKDYAEKNGIEKITVLDRYIFLNLEFDKINEIENMFLSSLNKLHNLVNDIKKRLPQSRERKPLRLGER